MPISVPEHADHRFRDDADHSFRDDPDQLIRIVGMVIAMPRNVFHRGEVALDITEGKLFSEGNLEKRIISPQFGYKHGQFQS